MSWSYTSALITLVRTWADLRDASGSAVRLGRGTLTEAMVSRGFRWILEDGTGSLPMAWGLGRLAREAIPGGVPLLAGGPGSCDMRLFLQPEVRGPRLVVTCQACGRERAYANIWEFDDDRDDSCPIRTVMES